MPLSQKKSQRSFLSRNIYQSLGTHCSRIIFLQWYRRGNRNINLGVFYLFSFTKRESWSSQWDGLSSGSIGKSIIEYFILKNITLSSVKKKATEKHFFLKSLVFSWCEATWGCSKGFRHRYLFKNPVLGPVLHKNPVSYACTHTYTGLVHLLISNFFFLLTELIINQKG